LGFIRHTCWPMQYCTYMTGVVTRFKTVKHCLHDKNEFMTAIPLTQNKVATPLRLQCYCGMAAIATDYYTTCIRLGVHYSVTELNL
jgi:hypothetical protein